MDPYEEDVQIDVRMKMVSTEVSTTMGLSAFSHPLYWGDRTATDGPSSQ